MGRIGGVLSNRVKIGFSRPHREGVPIFARSFLEGFFEAGEEPPPRLNASDLQHPEHFHERLAAFLMKQH